MSGLIHLLTEQAIEAERGGILGDADTELAELIKAVIAHGKAGELTLKLKIQPGGSASVNIAGEVVSKPPKPQAEVSLFFADDDGNLSRHNPKQKRLEFEVQSNPESKKQKDVKHG